MNSRPQVVQSEACRKWNARVLPLGPRASRPATSWLSQENAGVPFASPAKFWNSRLTLFAALTLLLAGCPGPKAGEEPPSALRVDASKAYKNLEDILALGPRPSGSEAARKNADLIAERIKACGLTSETDQWTERTPAGEIEFRNVTAKLAGRSDSFIILASHYDTKRMSSGMFVGANDGGSSTALLLEVIRVLTSAKTPPPLSVLFVFFDGEECVSRYGENDGLHGSRRLAGRMAKDGSLEKCAAMILLDMIGDKQLCLTLSPDTTEWLADAATVAAKELGHSERVGRNPGGLLDDHTPFQQAGVPCVDLIDFDYGPNNAYWHSSEDTIDKLSSESLAFVGDLTLRLMWKVPAVVKNDVRRK